MKAGNGLQGRSTHTTHSRDTNQDRVLLQIKSITSEIEALQTEIYSRMNQPEGVDFKRRSPAQNAADARVLAQFKVPLDRLRHVLWFYIEQLAIRTERNVHWEPSHLESGHLSDPGPVPLPEASKRDLAETPPGSFFERLNVVIDTYIKAVPAQANAKKRAKP